MYIGDWDGRGVFEQDVMATSKQLGEDLLLTRAEIGNLWDELKEGRQTHHETMAKIGAAPRCRNEPVLRLNIGGSYASVHLSVVEEAAGFQESVLGALFEGAWDQRVPRDKQVRKASPIFVCGWM